MPKIVDLIGKKISTLVYSFYFWGFIMLAFSFLVIRFELLVRLVFAIFSFVMGTAFIMTGYRFSVIKKDIEKLLKF